jgi:hypothetical protein
VIFFFSFFLATDLRDNYSRERYSCNFVMRDRQCSDVGVRPECLCGREFRR